MGSDYSFVLAILETRPFQTRNFLGISIMNPINQLKLVLQPSTDLAHVKAWCEDRADNTTLVLCLKTGTYVDIVKSVLGLHFTIQTYSPLIKPLIEALNEWYY